MKKSILLIVIFLLACCLDAEIKDSEKDNKEKEKKEFNDGKNTFQSVIYDVIKKAGFKCRTQVQVLSEPYPTYEEAEFIKGRCTGFVLCIAKVVSTQYLPMPELKGTGNLDLATQDLFVEVEIKELFWGKEHLMKTMGTTKKAVFRCESNRRYQNPDGGYIPRVNDEILLSLVSWENGYNPEFYSMVCDKILQHKTEGKIIWHQYFKRSMPLSKAVKIIKDVKKIGNELREKKGLKAIE
ncbi:MAG: hypothetical protein JXA60_12125 [Candidatus Coatesbacteria bacterium]|nr:hypothetical protein [Candidatus Coatesbacteria bacterium]